jgi:hypothetical protein
MAGQRDSSVAYTYYDEIVTVLVHAARVVHHHSTLVLSLGIG